MRDTLTGVTFTWPVDRSELPPLPELTDPPSSEYTRAVAERRAAEHLAVTVLHALSGRQFGLQTTIVRPCRTAQPFMGARNSRVTSYVVSWEGDRWLNLPCGCPGYCTVVGPGMVHLPGPVHEVTEVRIADTVLEPNVWTVEGDVLYRRDGPWPPQDLGRPAGSPGTWTVTYQRGHPVPPGVAELTGLLAKEFLAALDNEGRCRLPRTVTTVSRRGVTYQVYDPAVIYANGKTGLPEIDLWLAAVNPHHLPAAPTVI